MCVQKYAPDCLCSSRLCCRVFLYPFITFQVVSQYFILCLLQFLNTLFCFYCRFICCSDVWLPKLPKATGQKMQKVQNYHKKTLNNPQTTTQLVGETQLQQEDKQAPKSATPQAEKDTRKKKTPTRFKTTTKWKRERDKRYRHTKERRNQSDGPQKHRQLSS